MPRNGSGGVTRPVGGAFPAQASTLIQSSEMNISESDILSMLATSLASDGQTVATQRIPFAAGASTDTVTEKTADTGVTLDSVLLKDGRVDTTQGADITCAATLVLETATGNVVDVTGSTGPVTAVTLSQGHWRIVRFTGTPTITNGASLILPGAANIVVAAGDYALFAGYTAGVVRCLAYTRGFPASLNIEDQPLTGGVVVTSKDLGTASSGTVTPDPGDRPLQHYTNGGAHTLAPSANGGSILVDITNNGSAGAITTSGFTRVAGDSFTTTNAHKFRCHISIGNAGSLLTVQALQ